MKMSFPIGLRQQQRGFTLIEMLVTLLLLSSLLTVASSSFLKTTRSARDHQIVSQNEENARSLLDMLAYDFRMIGSGMPGGQDNFQMSDALLADSPYPIKFTSTNKQILMRVNQKGLSTVLTSDFTPGGFMSVDVHDGTIFEVDNEVYITNAVIDGEDGFHGLVTNVVGNTLTLSGTYKSSAAATFEVGSRIAPVEELYYDANDPVAGVLREDRLLTLPLLPNSTFTLEYLDTGGATIALPLDVNKLENQLAGIRITVTATSSANLENGAPHVATAEQIVSIRYLTINR